MINKNISLDNILNGVLIVFVLLICKYCIYYTDRKEK